MEAINHGHIHYVVLLLTRDNIHITTHAKVYTPALCNQKLQTKTQFDILLQYLISTPSQVVYYVKSLYLPVNTFSHYNNFPPRSVCSRLSIQNSFTKLMLKVSHICTNDHIGLIHKQTIHQGFYIRVILLIFPVWVPGLRIDPLRLLAECRKRRLYQAPLNLRGLI